MLSYKTPKIHFLVPYKAPKTRFLVPYKAPKMFTETSNKPIFIYMKSRRKKLLHNQKLIMEKKIQAWKKLRTEKRPPSGWLKAVRGALGMNARQLAKRCGILHSSILKIEKNEIQDKVSIESLKKVAEAMECQLLYAIVPKKKYDSFEDIIDHQALLIASKLIKKVDHTMQLEAQGVSSKELKLQIKKYANELKHEISSEIWEKNFTKKQNK